MRIDERVYFNLLCRIFHGFNWFVTMYVHVDCMSFLFPIIINLPTQSFVDEQFYTCLPTINLTVALIIKDA